jgi:hypothetical protein
VVNFRLPPGTLSASEIVAAPGGSVVTLVEALDGAPVDVANAWFLDAAGRWTRITGYRTSPQNAGQTKLVVEHLRPAPSGRVYATLEILPGPGQGQVRSTELVIDTRSHTVAAPATGDGDLLFDEDAAGIPLVGMALPGAIDWRHQGGSPIPAPGCEST